MSWKEDARSDRGTVEDTEGIQAESSEIQGNISISVEEITEMGGKYENKTAVGAKKVSSGPILIFKTRLVDIKTGRTSRVLKLTMKEKSSRRKELLWEYQVGLQN